MKEKLAEVWYGRELRASVEYPGWSRGNEFIFLK